MLCKMCNKETKVIDSRKNNDGSIIKRRRECLECGFRFNTKEVLKTDEDFKRKFK